MTNENNKQIERENPSRTIKRVPLKRIVETQTKGFDWISDQDLRENYTFEDELHLRHWVPKEELLDVASGDLLAFSHALSVKQDAENQGVKGYVVKEISGKTVARNVRRSMKQYEEENYTRPFLARTITEEEADYFPGMREAHMEDFGPYR